MMTHVRNCPLLIGLVTELLRATEYTLNDDLEPSVQELLELVVGQHCPESSTHLRCFRVLYEMSLKILPKAVYPCRVEKGEVTQGALQTLEVMASLEEEVAPLRAPLVYDESGLKNLLELLEEYHRKRKLDNVSLALHPDTTSSLLAMGDRQLTQLDEAAVACRKVTSTLLKSLRGTPVSWHASGRAAAVSFCAWYTLDDVVSLGHILLNTSLEDTHPEWNP